ncbi:MFS transporter [Dermacoccaceae bacterium W4C1]
MSLSPAPAPATAARAWAVWSFAVAVYVLAVFHRTSLGVAGVAAADRFGISSAQLATFATVQLAVYAAMQIPVGALLDRFGSRVLLLAGLATMTLAQFSFAFAHSYAAGLIARVAVGMGDAMVFVAVLRIVALWFPPARSPMVTQLTALLGQLGALLAAGPLAFALSGLGWQTTFLIASGVGVVLAIGLLLVVRDSPQPMPGQADLQWSDIGRAVRAAWAEPGTRLGLWCHFTVQFSSNVFAIIWGFPFLTEGQGLSTATASALLALMVVTTVIASPLFGAFAARYPYSRSTLVLWLVGATVIVWSVMLAWSGPLPMWLLVIAMVIIGTGGPGSVIGFDLARTFNPNSRIGSAIGIVNVGGFVASLVTVLMIGVVLDHVAPGGPSTYTADDFRWAMAVQYLGWVIGIVMILRYRPRARAVVHGSDEYAHLIPARLTGRIG